MPELYKKRNGKGISRKFSKIFKKNYLAELMRDNLCSLDFQLYRKHFIIKNYTKTLIHHTLSLLNIHFNTASFWNLFQKVSMMKPIYSKATVYTL